MAAMDLRRPMVLAQLGNVASELRLQVRSFVLVDDVYLGQLIHTLLYVGLHVHSGSLVGVCADLANSITHGLRVVSVVQSSLLLLTDSLER